VGIFNLNPCGFISRTASSRINLSKVPNPKVEDLRFSKDGKSKAGIVNAEQRLKKQGF